MACVLFECFQENHLTRTKALQLFQRFQTIAGPNKRCITPKKEWQTPSPTTKKKYENSVAQRVKNWSSPPTSCPLYFPNFFVSLCHVPYPLGGSKKPAKVSPFSFLFGRRGGRSERVGALLIRPSGHFRHTGPGLQQNGPPQPPTDGRSA